MRLTQDGTFRIDQTGDIDVVYGPTSNARSPPNPSHSRSGTVRVRPTPGVDTGRSGTTTVPYPDEPQDGPALFLDRIAPSGSPDSRPLEQQGRVAAPRSSAQKPVGV